MLFDKIASVYFLKKIYLYFSIGYGQPMEHLVGLAFFDDRVDDAVK